MSQTPQESSSIGWWACVTCPLPDAQTREAFSRACDVETSRHVSRAAWAFLAAVVVFWPTDLLLSDTAASAMVGLRVTLIVMIGASLAVLHLSSFRYRATLFVVASPLGVIVSLTYLGPLLTTGDGWFDHALLLPFPTMLVSVGIGWRTLFTFATSFAFAAAYVLLWPVSDTPEVWAWLINLSIAACCSVCIGHILYYRQWEYFLVSRELAAANDGLEAQVTAKTRELVELTRRHLALREEERARVAMTLQREASEVIGLMRQAVAPLFGDRDDYQIRIEGLLDALSGDLTQIVQDLLPSELEAVGLGGALENLAKRASAHSDLAIKTEIDPGITVVSHAAAALFRIAQEALNNAIRHAHPSQITVALRRESKQVVLLVRDDGCGFSDVRVGRRGLGLVSMHERAEALGASLNVRSDSSGTEVRVELPLPATTAKAIA